MKRLKKIVKRVFPVFLSLLIMLGTIFSNLQVAHATGMEPILYYTYWDLISSLYATCGYETTVDENVINNHGVTGKQVWDNFCTWVDLHVKAHNELVLEPAVKELKNLVNTATDKGVSLSQDLYDLLKECFAEQVSYGDMVNQFDTSSIESINKVVSTLTGGGYLSLDHAKAIMNGEALLNIVHDPSNGRYMAYAIKFKYGGIVDDYKINDPREDFLSLFVIDSTGKSKFYSVYGSVIRDSKTITDMSCYTAKPDMVWVVKNGAFMANDTIGAQVSAGACPQEVPDVSPWIKNPAIPDEWRIVQPGEKPDKDPDKEPEKIIPFVPIKPLSPDKEPDSTENPGEKPDKDKDKKKNPLLLPIINPDTGNVVDPETGWDIDPETGWLMNPDTGELVDPDSVHKSTNVVDSAGKFGDITTLFPFCIPFDLVKLIKGMKAKKAPPVFHFEYYFKSIDYNFVIDVDLTDYDKYIKIFRYGMQIFYIIALMFMTARMSDLFS